MKFVILLPLLLLACTSSLAAAQLVLPGGKQTINVHDAMLVATLGQVEPILNSRLSSPFYSRIGAVLSAEAQIVDGLLYSVTFELGQTSCLKTEVHPLEGCQVSTALKQICQATIFSQPWEHKTELTSFHCDGADQNQNNQEGGLYTVDPDDADMKAALLSAEKTMSDRYDSPYISQVGKVLEAQAQVVAGIKYFVTFKFGQTYRLKGKQYDEPQRRSEVVRHLVTCHVQLWVAPGVQVAEVLDFHCDN